MSNVIATLKKMHMFKSVKKDALQALLKECEPTNYSVGQVICTQGDLAINAMVLLSGKLDVSVQTDTSTRHVGSIHPGEIFGEQGLFHSNGIRNATVKAAKPSICLQLTPRIMQTHSTNPAMVALEQHLIATMARRIRSTNLEIQKAWMDETKAKKPKESNTEPEQKENASLLGRLRSLFGK
ncbi:MAG: cyclic nucleotide-binding domain-containing protein [Myxococcota bacterium]|nr:cyclic nucleotide-binding domain-containing protein [Myxococcota bacterium]